MSWLDDPIQAIDTRPVSGTLINTGSPLIPGTLGFVSPMGIQEDDSFYPFNVSGIVPANTPDFSSFVGMAVAIDTTAPNTVRLAQAGDTVFGVLMQLEFRAMDSLILGTVALRGCYPLPLDPTAGATKPTIGSLVKGGTVPGTVVLLAAVAGVSSGVVVFVDPNGVFASVIF